MTATSDPMQRAIALAKDAAAHGEVPVGAVVFDPKTGEIVADGHNQPIADHDPTAHAEIKALRAAAAKIGNYRLTGLHLYVTLEPCAMCAGAISLARIEKLIFAADDPKGGAVLHGPKFFEQETCHWRPAVEQDETYAEEAGAMLTDFFRARRKSQKR
ncbi:MAG: nucleoside deaminase [Pseudomonadota bacterium]